VNGGVDLKESFVWWMNSSVPYPTIWLKVLEAGLTSGNRNKDWIVNFFF
jgi:hypothetical protein